MKMTCLKACKSEFQLQNFKLNHEKPHRFVTTQCGPRLLYPIWSLICTIYHCVWNVILVPVLLQQYGLLPNPRYFIFLTNWGYVFLTTTVLCDFIATSYVHLKRKDILDGSSICMPWYLKTVWAMWNIAGTNCILITLGYYALLKPVFNALSIGTHLLNSVYIIANIFISAKPIRIYHMYMPMLFLVLYSLFSVIWHFAGGSPIYQILDWTKVTNSVTVTFLLILIGAPVCHMVLFGCYKLRQVMFLLCCTKVEDVSTDSKEMKNVYSISKENYANGQCKQT